MTSTENSQIQQLDKKLVQIQKTVEEIKRLQRNGPSVPVTPPTPSARSRKRGLRECQGAIRQIIGVLSTEEEEPLVIDLVNYSSDSVRQARERVIKEVKLRNNKEVWATDATLQVAFKNVWENKRDEASRAKSGKKEEHRQQCRRNKRVAKKLSERLQAIEYSSKPGTWKEKFLPLLKREITSPEVSDDEETSSARYVLPFAWESDAFADGKAHLDSIIRARASEASLKKRARVEDHPTRMVHVIPGSVPEWAIRPTFEKH